VTEVVLPPGWSHGLEELPGYDSGTRLIRLTNDLELTRDAWGNTVGYLGRAHPLVRRAIERVRNLSFGGGSPNAQDLRASVVAADVTAPELLFTFLGRVESRAGRELEQVVSVRCQVSGVRGQDSEVREQGSGGGDTANDIPVINCTTMLEPGDWLGLADPQRALRTTGVYERDFQTWFEQAAEEAREAAVSDFAPSAADFTRERQRELAAERARQDDWLRQRANEIAPMNTTQPAQQLSLFEVATEQTPAAPAPAAWQSLADPAERLAAFHGDATQPARLRSAADGVLRIYRQRLADLQARLDVRAPDLVPLGALMIVPNK
jgi:hypothetical protein